MSFEAPSPLYPERASANLDVAIERLQKIESGETEKIKLTESERLELLSFENSLGEELEQIVKIKNISSTIHTDYLFTEAGQEDFEKTFGLDIKAETPETIESFIYEHRDIFIKTPPTWFSNRAGAYADTSLLEALENSMDESGEINTNNIQSPTQISLLLTTERALEKLTLLRNFKRKLKSESEKKEQLPKNSALELATLKIIKLYKRKTNQLLSDTFSTGVAIENLSKNIGENNLTAEEKMLLSLFRGLNTPEKNYSRYDRFIHGASADYDEIGNRLQISPEIIAYADNLDSEYMENELCQETRLRDRGLDPAKIFEKNIPCAEFSAIEESLLRHYDSLSEHPATEYDPNGIGSAPDNKWRFIARPDFKSMSVMGGRKIIKAPPKNQSVETMITVLCGHETEGHFIQSLNREKIPLKLLNSNQLGTDRTSLFSEGGAMMV